MYTFEQFAAKWLARDFRLELNGHFYHAFDAGRARDWALRKVDERIERVRKSAREHPAEPDEQSHWGVFHKMLRSDNGCTVGDVITLGGLVLELECQDCSDVLWGFLLEPDLVSFTTYDHTPGAAVAQCPAASAPGPQVTEIDVPSGRLVFANYFDGILDTPSADLRYDRAYNISSLWGRRNIASHLAGHDVGFGQMGNITAHLFAKPGCSDSIVITRLGRDHYEETLEWLRDEGRLEELAEFEAGELGDLIRRGYTEVGALELSVWRWMCADEETMARHPLCPCKGKPVIVDVSPGRWRIVHHFDTAAEDALICSTLEQIT